MSHEAYKQLKPCPFCGASAFLRQCPAKGFRPAGTRITFQVGCTNNNFDECPLRPGSIDFDFPSEQAAVTAWNTRTIDTDLLATVRREVFKDAEGMMDAPTAGTMASAEFHKGFESMRRLAKRVLERAALEASATEKEGMNGD